MSKIDKNANLYDIDGNIISKAPLPNKTISEVEQLVDDLTKKVEENPDNEVYKVYLNNAQSFLFAMYNNMNKDELMSRLSVLQNAIQTAKDKANESEIERLDSTNKALEQLKESYAVGDEAKDSIPESKPMNQDGMLVDRDDDTNNMDEYTDFTEVNEDQ